MTEATRGISASSLFHYECVIVQRTGSNKYTNEKHRNKYFKHATKVAEISSWYSKHYKNRRFRHVRLICINSDNY